MVYKLNGVYIFFVLLTLWTSFGIAYESIDILLTKRRFDSLIVFQSAFVLSLIVSLPSAFCLKKMYQLVIDGDEVTWRNFFGKKLNFNLKDVLKIELNKCFTIRYFKVTLSSHECFIPLMFENNLDIEFIFNKKSKVN